MSLAERLANDMKESMKAKDQARLDTLRLVRAEMLKKEKEKVGTKLDDAAIAAILESMAKQRRDSIEQFRAGNREDLAVKEEAELAILAAYMPEALTDAEADTIISDAIAQAGATAPKDMGKVMGPLMKALKATGKSFDGKAVNERVKARLGG